MEGVRKIIHSDEGYIKNIGHYYKVKFKDNGWGDENGVVDACQDQNAVKQYIKTGDIVEINNTVYRVKAVETFASCRVWTAGVAVEEIEQLNKLINNGE